MTVAETPSTFFPKQRVFFFLNLMPRSKTHHRLGANEKHAPKALIPATSQLAVAPWRGNSIPPDSPEISVGPVFGLPPNTARFFFFFFVAPPPPSPSGPLSWSPPPAKTFSPRRPFWTAQKTNLKHPRLAANFSPRASGPAPLCPPYYRPIPFGPPRNEAPFGKGTPHFTCPRPVVPAPTGPFPFWSGVVFFFALSKVEPNLKWARFESGHTPWLCFGPSLYGLATPNFPFRCRSITPRAQAGPRDGLERFPPLRFSSPPCWGPGRAGIGPNV